ncbi:MAG: SLC13 family permease [Planctomycetaceae bacterium]|nr:SLC13 family permease [Planctomycetaceae bacterium]
MPWEAWLTIVAVCVLLSALAANLAPADCLVGFCLIAICCVGEVSGSERIPTISEAVAGFGNPGMLTVGMLFVVVAGLVQTGAMLRFAAPLLGHPTNVRQAQWRIMLPVAGLSAFLNNTPIVAMFMPVVDDLCRRTGISPSKVFMPLSCASTLGGLCTLLGTSTNLVVGGMLATQAGIHLGMFDCAWIGIPTCLTGVLFIILFQHYLLPDRKPPINLTDDPRQYSVEMQVPVGSPLIGQSVHQAGLRHLPGLFLAEIERGGEILPAVSPEQRLCAGDRLVFVGVVDSVVDLRKIRGLEPPSDQRFHFADRTFTHRSLIEVVVSDRCPLVGKSIRDGHFRSVYGAAVIAVARSGRRIDGRIGDIILSAGDTLLLEARPSFLQEHRNSPDFYLVSGVENSNPPRHESAWTAVSILIAMILAASVGGMQMLTAAAVAAILMVLTKCCSVREARSSIDWSVLTVIGASLGIGEAMKSTGAAGAIADGVISVAGGHPTSVLAAVYLCTMLFTELITNNAAAVLVLPIALSAAAAMNVSVMPFAMAVMMAASCGFATPIGYQTSLMVYGPGGYRFADYLRLGIPLDLVLMLLNILLLPVLWPF